ncbi:MAG: beta-N-acetylhexosaminidase [Gammaproteobacteria bacterium]|nr:beta-N-acetylhexosaminidase [Gammaproteobacteria bacterium]MCP5407044.1 beta-N-acetylhexosaminidase [Chromatiaceae bacterium]MCP5445110.1 beta-N-acetylhexosaminidase [Chromatiaceae bacterium]
MSHGPLMLDLQGVELTNQERELLLHPAAGGVILFRRNFETPDQLNRLVSSIHALREPKLLVAVDQEGGRVQRFCEGFTRLPPAAWFGRLYDDNPHFALEAVQSIGWLMASELLAEGIDFSFAPVLDLGTGVSEVIGDRAFHRNSSAVAELAHAWIKGVHAAGMAAVGKHFPGHGNVSEDSHLALPVDRRRREEILMDDLLPFRRLIENGMEAVMPAHVIYAMASPQLAGFSSYWLKQILRGELGFQGVIFSDDLSMAAAGEAGSVTSRAGAALEAGCDMVLVCNDQESAAKVLDELKDYSDPAAQMRLIRMHGRRKLKREKLHTDKRWKNAVEMVACYESNPILELDL